MFNYNAEIASTIIEVKNRELDGIDFETEMAGSTKDYFIRPTIGLTDVCEPIVRYGVFNRKTGLLEAESLQVLTARAWAEKLTDALHEKSEKQREMPGLDAPAGLQ